LNTPTDTAAIFFGGWRLDSAFLPAVRSLFEFDGDRATGNLYGDGKDWPDPLAVEGPALLDALEAEVGIRFTHVAYQAYRNGSGCDWHSDTPFEAQAVLSLGTTRKFGIRRIGGAGDPVWFSVRHGDLVYMPPGHQDEFQHCVPVEDEPGQRVSLVFRTPRS